MDESRLIAFAFLVHELRNCQRWLLAGPDENLQRRADELSALVDAESAQLCLPSGPPPIYTAPLLAADATFRDECAVAAMSALLTTWPQAPAEHNTPGSVSRTAYAYADAMIAERERTRPRSPLPPLLTTAPPPPPPPPPSAGQWDLFPPE